MCGIVALYAYGAAAPPVSQGELLRIRDAMLRRGPDAAGAWLATDRRVALAHRRLSIIDLSASADQPMTLADSGTRITFNGEIYNYREVRRELEERGRVFRTDSDTEVLLHGYEEYGAAVVERLRGMYAFAIWDARRRGLFLARDPFGIKPLYYADDGTTIAVASQAKALVAGGRSRNLPSVAGQVSFLLWGFVLEPHTFYADVRALPAGSTMWIDAAGARPPAQFWSVAETFREALARRPEIDLKRHLREAVVAELRDALADSVRHHLVADVPVGVFLSGGLDSATLVSLAAAEAGQDVRALTLGFEDLRGAEADEVVYANQTASACPVAHEVHWIGSGQFIGERERLLAAMDQPTIDGVNVYFISQMAANSGLKVALSGLGGDELFGGYASFRQIPGLVRLLRSVARSPEFGRGFRQLSAPVLSRLTSPKYAGLFEFGGSLEGAYLLRRALYMPWELANLLDPEIVAAGLAELEIWARLRGSTAVVPDSRMRARVACLEMDFYMRNQLLRDADWAGMAHSVEIRVPFVDHVLLRRLAPLLMIPTALGKREMTDAAPVPLPSGVLARPKTGFAVPIRELLVRDSAHARAAERGLRGWARYLLGEQLRAAPEPPPAPVGLAAAAAALP